jgi:hypothetical protein
MADAPYREDALPTLELLVAEPGKAGQRRYELTAHTLRREWPDRPERTKSITLADVTKVELAALGGTTICTLQAKDGSKLELSSGFDPMPPGSERERLFVTMLEALNERVAIASPHAMFVQGSWTVIGGLIISVLIGLGALAWLANDAVMRTTLKFEIACVCAGIAVLVALPIAIVRARPKPYDPRKVPRVYDPVKQRR